MFQEILLRCYKEDLKIFFKTVREKREKNFTIRISMRLDTLEAWTELNWYDFYVVLLNDEKIYTLNSTESHLQRRAM